MPHPLVLRLVELETLKTWSLIVTLFGDLDGDTLTGTQIRSLMGHIGIKPEAIRVALHRLKSDGWIDVAKKGREAVYCLSVMGQQETNAAIADVYRRQVKYPEGWQFLLVKEAAAAEGAIALTRGLHVAPKAASCNDVAELRLNPANDRPLPEWVEDALVPRKMRQNAAALVDVLKAAEDARTTDPDAAWLRLLTVHHWRRLALRTGSWAHIGLQPDGALAHCHSSVTRFLEKETRLTGAEIERWGRSC